MFPDTSLRFDDHGLTLAYQPASLTGRWLQALSGSFYFPEKEDREFCLLTVTFVTVFVHAEFSASFPKKQPSTPNIGMPEADLA